MVINSYGKSPFEIRDSAGKEFKKIYDNQGRLLFKNWNKIQGSLPMQFKSYADYLKDYRIYGNSVQNGTPTPETPVEVQGCGVRTTNLINIEQYNTENVLKHSDGSYFVQSYGKWSWCIPTEIGKTYCVSVSLMNEYKNATNLEIALCKGYRTSYTSADNAIKVSVKNVEPYEIHTRTFSFTATDEWLTIVGMSTHVYTIMINENSVALPYEPYGYKIPVTVSNGTNSVTTPVYIGSEPLHKIGDYTDYVDFKRGVVVRRIRKIVLKGEEKNGWANPVYRVPISLPLTEATISINALLICASHYITNESSENSEDFKDVHTIRRSTGGKAAWFFIPKSFFSGEINKENCISQFKAYLATQYSSGTPVTVWYVIDEPQEEQLESLLPIQTFKDSDVLTADTTVQPSEIYIKGKIR